MAAASPSPLMIFFLVSLVLAAIALLRSSPATREAKFASGGMVEPMKKGVPISPITKEKRMNGVPGMKGGGKC